MADTESELANCIGAIYEAAANGGSWEDVGARLCRLTDAQRATTLGRRTSFIACISLSGHPTMELNPAYQIVADMTHMLAMARRLFA